MVVAPPRRIARAAGIVLAPLLAFVVLAALPFPACQSRLLFGVPCPGCGLTRATNALVHLRFVESLRMHPLAIFVLAYLGVEMIRAVLRELEAPPRPWLEALVSNRIRTGLAIALVTVFVVRLAGGLGGLPDDVDVRHGLIGRAVAWVFQIAASVMG